MYFHFPWLVHSLLFVVCHRRKDEMFSKLAPVIGNIENMECFLSIEHERIDSLLSMKTFPDRKIK